MEVILNYSEKMVNALMSFNWVSDLFDVLLVTVVIYEAIKLLRGSRSFQVIKGVILLIVLYAVVKILDMEASDFLISKLFENALLILVILFAPEFRNILERFGSGSIHGLSLFNFKNSDRENKEITETVNDFCKAAVDLSETKTGALVVFEKNATLTDIINTGTVLDAQSSPELFNGLFFKNSALHDGAVVVRNARIYAAGCILPLTNKDIGSELGTRHRAAMGMSENSDAVVVVISEETGAISVVKDGILNRGVSSGELREILLKALVKNTQKAQKKREIIFRKDNKENGDEK